MKYNKIIKAINEGLDKALMSFEDDEAFDKSSKIGNKNVEYTIYLEKSKKIVDPVVSGWRILRIHEYTWLVEQYLSNGFQYTVKTIQEFKILVNTCRYLISKCNLNWIDVSNITNMAHLFQHHDKYSSEVDISQWDVSNVTNMSYMFAQSNFNGDISKWDVHNVTDMSGMFQNARFDGDISEWDVSNVKYHTNVFANCPIREEYKPKFKNI